MLRVLLLTKKVSDAADFLTLTVLIGMTLSLFSTIYFEFSGKYERVCKYSTSCLQDIAFILPILQPKSSPG